MQMGEMLSFLVLLAAVFVMALSEGEEERRNLVLSGLVAKNRGALLAWSASLTEDDEDPKKWIKQINPNPPQIFDHYVVQLSKMFERHTATLNFVSVGACDGTNDFTITERFFPNKHWDAIFVEPMSNNYRDLVDQLKKANVFDRSFALRAAATSRCTKPTITVMRPLYEDLGNKKAPHWLRRQIGSIKPEGQKARSDWGDEEVLCVTGADVLNIWNRASKGVLHKDLLTGFNVDTKEHASRQVVGPAGRLVRRRPHILKVDVEGHDFEVLSSFLNTTVTTSLPLLVAFEAKSLGPKYQTTVKLLQSRGYVVSDFKSDGFALLRGSAVLPKTSPGSGAGKRGSGGGDWRGDLERKVE